MPEIPKALKAKLNLPPDATMNQVLAAADVLLAKAEARTAGTVAKTGILASAGLPEGASPRLLGAAIDTMMLQNAAKMGMPASSSPVAIRKAVEATQRAEQRIAASSTSHRPQPAANAIGQTAGKRIAASTPMDPRGVYASNPLVGQVQQMGGYQPAVEASNGYVPSLFASGDVPVFCASGIDPVVLKGVPWQARHALATEPDRAKALQMYEELSGPDGDIAAAEYANHPGNADYERRVVAWSSAGWDHQRTVEAESRKVAASAQAAEVTEAVGAVEDWTDEQVYEHVFGPLERREAERKIADEMAYAEGRTISAGYRVQRNGTPQ